MSKKTVKLTPAELEVITSLQKQKQDLDAAYRTALGHVNQNEAIVIKLVKERAKINEEATSILIEESNLVFEFAKPEKPAKEVKEVTK
jgi:hypothetical protein